MVLSSVAEKSQVGASSKEPGRARPAVAGARSRHSPGGKGHFPCVRNKYAAHHSPNEAFKEGTTSQVSDMDSEWDSH